MTNWGHRTRDLLPPKFPGFQAHPRPIPPLGGGLRALSKNPPEPLGEGDTYVDAVDARDSRGARRPRRTLLTRGSPLTRERTWISGVRGATTRNWTPGPKAPRVAR